MRQPADWNESEFDAPVMLREEDESSVLDEEWWAGSFQSPAKSPVSTQTRETPTKESIEGSDSLDLIQRSLDTLDYPRLLSSLEKECSVHPSRLVVRNETTIPQKRHQRDGYDVAYAPLLADSVEGAQRRYQAVREIMLLLDGTQKDLQDVKSDVRGRPPPLGGNSYNMDEIFAITKAGKVLQGPELYDVSEMVQGMEAVRKWGYELSKSENFEELPRMASAIFVNETLRDLLHTALDKQGRLSSKAFPVLGRIRDRIKGLKTDIVQTIENLISLPSMQKVLALESGGPSYSQVNGRLVVPVRSKHAGIGIVHDTSRSQQTLYVEPNEVVGPTNELRRLEGELRTEEGQIWRSLTRDVVTNQQGLQQACAAIGQIDLTVARYRLGFRQLKGVIPEVKGEGVIHLSDAKHPVLLLRQIENVVGSDVDLGAGKNQGLVLTGPNSGGKTIILKLLGLVALMARGGIPVPARRSRNGDQLPARVDFFDPVLADIGDMQSVGGDLSTFSGHMLVCREVLANSGENALVLMDELGSGTDPNQGVAIAQALLEAILDTGARSAITTHYMQLKQLAASDDRFSVGGMQFINGRPTYKLLPGTVGESFALAVAERLKLPRSVLDRAEALMDSETRQMGDLIRELEQQKSLVDQQILDLEEKEKEIGQMKYKMEEERIRLEKKQLSVRREEAKKFARMLEEKEGILETVLEKLKSDPSRRVLAKSWDDIRFVKRDALNEAENIPSVMARKLQAAADMESARAELVPIAEMREKPKLSPGEKLIICQKGPVFGREGTVLKALGSRVELRINNMNMSFKLSQVALPPQSGTVASPEHKSRQRPNSISKAAAKALADERRGGGGDSSSTMQDIKTPKKKSVTIRTDVNTVDVRGCNLNEAQSKVKEKLSNALMAGRPVFYVLHGHGSGGVLKSKLRNWLRSESKLVKKYGPADASDGGDAFTRVELR